MRRLGALLLVAGCSSPTTLLVEVDAAAGVEVRTLTLSVQLPGGNPRSALLNGMPPPLPGRALVKLDDVEQDVRLALDGIAADGSTLHAETTAHSLPHQQVDVMLTVGAAMADGGADLASGDGPPADLASSDLAGAIHYERQLNVTNGAGAALPIGYTVRVPLDPANFPDAKLRSDLLDVRLFGPSGEQPRVIDPSPPGQPRALWLALARPIAAGASDNGYSIHYGDPNGTASSADATKVFALYDGFDGGALASVWQVSGTPTIGGGVISLHANGSDGICTTAANDGVPTLSALEWRSKVSDPTSAGQVTTNGTFWYWYGYQHTGGFNPSDPWILFIARAANEIHGERKVSSGGGGACNVGCTTGANVTLDNSFHWYRIERSPETTRFYFDGALSYSVDGPNDTDYSVMLRNWAVTSNSQVDWIRARALATPEPTVTIGAETVH